MLIITGSIDRRICCSSLELDISGHENCMNEINFDKSKLYMKCKALLPQCSIQMHRSSVETICILAKDNSPDPDGPIVLSGGGRSELLIWQLETRSIYKLIFLKHYLHLARSLHFLYSSQIGSTSSDCDLRLISIAPIDSRFIIILCSDGTIRFIFNIFIA
jgi:WD40 repeat protein